jgi:hypothetical protein
MSDILYCTEVLLTESLSCEIVSAQSVSYDYPETSFILCFSSLPLCSCAACPVNLLILMLDHLWIFVVTSSLFLYLLKQ